MMSGHDLAMALRLSYLAMHRRTDVLMSAYGVTADQFVVLRAISESEGLSQRELSDRTACDRNSLREMLLLLEKQGLVERKPCLQDKRAWSVSLTPIGRKKLKILWKQSDRVRSEISSIIPERPMAVVIQYLNLLTQSW